MPIDPYSLCPCGSGKKVKWCCATILPELDRVVGLIENNQIELALNGLDRLSERGVNPPYIETLRAQALARFEKIDEAVKSIDKTIEHFPTSGLARETRGDLLGGQEDYAEALEGYLDALTHYSPEATTHIARALLKAGSCHNFQGRPLAAWAAWRCALKLEPGFEAAEQAIEQYIHANHMLPKPARDGLTLKPPDELAVFNEERQRKWDDALGREIDWQVDDLVAAFDYLANDDLYDMAAWHNLGVSAAWAGDNAKAIDAFEHYVTNEEDFEAAAQAWDLCEVLRLGVGAEEYSDNIQFVAVYESQDPRQMLERLNPVRNLVVMRSPDGGNSLHWLDREIPNQDSGLPTIGAPPKQLAQLLLKPDSFQVVARSAENLAEVEQSLDRIWDGVASRVGMFRQPGSIQTLDSEPFLAYHLSGKKGADREAVTLDAIARYFEEDWISRSLKALAGLSPLDAAAGPALYAKIEGLIRFRERHFARFESGYDFDRLRNKLGLATAPPPDASVPSLSASSAAQLAALEPSTLDDEALLEAYRTANSLDAERTALDFATEILERDSLYERIDMAEVCRRLVKERRSTGQAAKGTDTVLKCIDADARRSGGKDRWKYDELLAEDELHAGNLEGACERFRHLFEEQPENLELLARATERMLSSGNFPQASEFAELGQQRAERMRASEFQGQFREYLQAAESRA